MNEYINILELQGATRLSFQTISNSILQHHLSIPILPYVYLVAAKGLLPNYQSLLLCILPYRQSPTNLIVASFLSYISHVHLVQRKDCLPRTVANPTNGSNGRNCSGWTNRRTQPPLFSPFLPSFPGILYFPVFSWRKGNHQLQHVSYKRYFRCNNCFLLLVYTTHLSLNTNLVDPPPMRTIYMKHPLPADGLSLQIKK